MRLNQINAVKAIALVMAGAMFTLAGVGCDSGTKAGSTDGTGKASPSGDAIAEVGTTCASWTGQTAEQQKRDSTQLAKNNGSKEPADGEITLTRLAITIFCANHEDKTVVIDGVHAWAKQIMGTDEPQTPPDGSITNDPFQGATADGGIYLGKDLKPGGPASEDIVRVDLFFDYICPVCKSLEDAIGGDLRQRAQKGEIALVVHPMGFLDVYSTTEYSTRAANAAVTIAAKAPEQFMAFDTLLWEHQPAENGEGLSDEAIAGLAKQAGVGDDVIAQLPGKPYADWVIKSTETGTTWPGFRGTPFVLMSDGKSQYSYTWGSGNLDQAIANVKAGKAP